MLNYRAINLSSKREGKIKLPSFYTLYGNGRTRTVLSRDEARNLLNTGKWFDRTIYKNPSEAIQYESNQSSGSYSSQASSEREKPKHEPNYTYPSYVTGEELDSSSVRSGASNSQVVTLKKRGRPKGVAHGSS